MSEMSERTDAELYTIIEQSADAALRTAARAELELRSFRRWRVVADRQLRIAWLAVIAACASAVAAVCAVMLAWTHR
jgi:hypothetical protein